MIQGLSEHSSLASFAQGPKESTRANSAPEASPVQTRKAPSRDISSQSVGNQALDEIVAQVQETLDQVEPRIKLSIDGELNRVVVKVFDTDSGELIRQFPPEDILKIQRFLKEHSGLLLTEEA